MWLSYSSYCLSACSIGSRAVEFCVYFASSHSCLEASASTVLFVFFRSFQIWVPSSLWRVEISSSLSFSITTSYQTLLRFWFLQAVYSSFRFLRGYWRQRCIACRNWCEYQDSLWAGLILQEAGLSLVALKSEIPFVSYIVFPITREPMEQAERQ